MLEKSLKKASERNFLSVSSLDDFLSDFLKCQFHCAFERSAESLRFAFAEAQASKTRVPSLFASPKAVIISAHRISLRLLAFGEREALSALLSRRRRASACVTESDTRVKAASLSEKFLSETSQL